MNILILDTATSIEIVVVSGESGVHQAIAPMDRSHSVSLFTSISACLDRARLTIHDMDCIGVGIGPGSFTGIRIALSTARMLAQLLHKPLVGVKSPLIFASSLACGQGDMLCIAFDAKKKRVFGALYEHAGDSFPREIMPPGDYSMEYLCEHIDPDRKVVAAGDGIERYRDVIAGSAPRLDYRKDFLPDGNTTARLFVETYRSNPRAWENYSMILPFYARKSDAEIALESKKSP